MRTVAGCAAVVALILAGCGGGRPAPAPSNRVAPAPTADRAIEEPGRCYPYLPAPDGSCPTTCGTRDDCAGSRGPADLAEHGWPLDCVQQACVPLPPSHVHGRS